MALIIRLEEDRDDENLSCAVTIRHWRRGEHAWRDFAQESRELMGACKNLVTLKALANSRPGFALKPWLQK